MVDCWPWGRQIQNCKVGGFYLLNDSQSPYFAHTNRVLPASFARRSNSCLINDHVQKVFIALVPRSRQSLTNSTDAKSRAQSHSSLMRITPPQEEGLVKWLEDLQRQILPSIILQFENWSSNYALNRLRSFPKKSGTVSQPKDIIVECRVISRRLIFP